MAIARAHGLAVIEDAAQSMGAQWAGQEIGRSGDLVSFSFHANKNMTTTEGGCLVLRTEDEAQRFEKLRLQGVARFADGSMDVEAWGGKANLTDVAAAIGLGQLKRLDEFNARRRVLAQRYFECFPQELGFELPPADFEHSNWHMFQIILPLQSLGKTRSQVMLALKELGIGTGVHYPIITNFELYRRLGYSPDSTPIAAEIGRSILTLPLFPSMSTADIDRVISGLEVVLA